jgi:Flp pilus assembly protein TadG
VIGAPGDTTRRAFNTRGEQEHDAGAALVEFALVVTLLLTLLVGIVEFGRGYSMKVQLTGAVRDGSRAAALGKSTGEVTGIVAAAAPGLTIASTNVTACAGGGGGNATVTSTANFTYNIPFFGSSTQTLTATGVMRCGG